jgi:hypothetical protein
MAVIRKKRNPNEENTEVEGDQSEFDLESSEAPSAEVPEAELQPANVHLEAQEGNQSNGNHTATNGPSNGADAAKKNLKKRVVRVEVIKEGDGNDSQIAQKPAPQEAPIAERQPTQIISRRIDTKRAKT